MDDRAERSRSNPQFSGSTSVGDGLLTTRSLFQTPSEGFRYSGQAR